MQASTIIDRIRVNDPDLTSVDLSYSQMGGRGAIQLSKALTVNTYVREVILYGNQFGDKGAIAFGEMLMQNRTIQYVDLASNGIGALGAATLSRAIKVSTSLLQLKLSRNQLGSKGALSFSEGLKSSLSLKKLDLRFNGIGDSGATAMATALMQNETLTSICLASNEIDHGGIVALSKMVAVNRTLIEITLWPNKFGALGAQVFSTALQENLAIIEVGRVQADSPWDAVIKQHQLRNLDLHGQTLRQAAPLADQQLLQDLVNNGVSPYFVIGKTGRNRWATEYGRLNVTWTVPKKTPIPIQDQSYNFQDLVRLRSHVRELLAYCDAEGEAASVIETLQQLEIRLEHRLSPTLL